MQTVSQDKASEQTFYNQLFSVRGRFDQFPPDVYRQMAAEARKNTRGTDALDLGCGAGDLTLCLIEQGFSVTAVDLSPEAVKLTERTVTEHGKSVVAINADAENLPLPDASVDACTCSLLLHHFGDLDGVARELSRVVKPGGVVIALDANAHNPFSFLFFNVYHRYRPLKGVTLNQRAIGKAEIRTAFQRHGFSDFEFRSVTTKLKQDWLGGSLGARLNFYTRKGVLGLSDAVLPQISKGNCILSVFRKQSLRDAIHQN